MQNLLNLKKHLCFFLLLIPFGVSSQGSGLPNPEAHYTLEVPIWRYEFKRSTQNIGGTALRMAEIYDFSGNGHHGHTIDPDFIATSTSNPDEQLYEHKTDHLWYSEFPDAGAVNKVTCIKKEDNTKEGHITIPDPFGASSNMVPDYTVSFWYKIKPGMDQTIQSIINTPHLVVQLDNGRLGLNSLNMGWQGKVAPNALTEGWYHLMVSENSLGNVSMYIYDYANNIFTSLYENDLIPSASPIESPSHSTILSKNCQGSIKDVRFYNETFVYSQFQSLTQLDLDWVEGKYSSEHFIHKNLYSHYPFEGTTESELLTNSVSNSRNGISQVGAKRIQGNLSEWAVNLDDVPGAHIELPALFDNDTRTHVPFQLKNDPDYEVEGFTISFWVKIENSISKQPDNKNGYPFNDDTERSVFLYGNDASGNHLFGIQRVGDRLGLFRYADLQNIDRYPYYHWLYDPINFEGQTGWYHVVWVQANEYSRIYLWQPNSGTECDCFYDIDCQNCACISMYQELQNLEDVTSWGVGSPTSEAKGPAGMDDLRIYNFPLGNKAVMALHEESYQEFTDLSTFDMYLMVGGTFMEGQVSDMPSKNVEGYLFNDQDKFIQYSVSNNIGFNAFNSYGNTVTTSGFASDFSNEISSLGDGTTPVGLIVNANAGKSIRYWADADQSCYQDTYSRLARATNSYNGDLKAIIWAGDSEDSPTADYTVENFEADMRSLLQNWMDDYPEVPIVLVQYPNVPLYTDLNHVLNIMEEEYDGVFVVSSAGLTFTDGQDMHELAERIAERVFYEQCKFVIIGDYGWDGSLFENADPHIYNIPDNFEGLVADQINGYQPNFIITTGDNSYSDTMEDPSSFNVEQQSTIYSYSFPAVSCTIDDNVGKYYADYIYPYNGSQSWNGMEINRFFPVVGNHDLTQRPVSGVNGETESLDYFPVDDKYGETGIEYYDFVRGNIHFIALDNTEDVTISGETSITYRLEDYTEEECANGGEYAGTIACKQLSWLKSTVENSQAKYIIVYFHNPPYATTSKNKVAPAISWVNWMRQPSIVLSGDLHQYERLIDGNGMTYVINGIGGHPSLKVPYNQDVEQSDNSVFLNNIREYGYMTAVEKKDHVLFEMLNIDGVVRDQFELYPDGSVVSKPITHDPLAPMDVFIVVGGDNLSGLANFGSEEQSESISGMHILNGQGVFETIITDANTTEGLNKYSNLNLSGDVTKLGPAYYFAKELASLDGCFNKPIGLIVNADPGSTILDWTSTATDSNYDKTLLRYNQADGGYDISVKGIIWMGQVEDNANGTNSAQYKIDMETLISNFHTDLGNNIPVYLVAPPADEDEDINVQYDLKGIISANEMLGTGAYVQAISSDGIAVSGGDYASRASLQEIGQRMSRVTCPVTAWIDEIDFDRNITFNTDLSGYDLTLLPSLPVGSYDYSSELSYELDEGLEYSGNSIISPDQLTLDASHVFSMTAVITNNGVEYKREINVTTGMLQEVANKLQNSLIKIKQPYGDDQYSLSFKKKDQNGLSINISLYDGFQSNNNDLLSATSEGWKSSKLSTDYDYTFLFEYVVLENPLSDQSYTWIRQESSNLTSSDRRRLAADALGIEDVSFHTLTPSTSSYGTYDDTFTVTLTETPVADMSFSSNQGTVSFNSTDNTLTVSGLPVFNGGATSDFTITVSGTVDQETVTTTWGTYCLLTDEDMAAIFQDKLQLKIKDYSYSGAANCKYGLEFSLEFKDDQQYALPDGITISTEGQDIVPEQALGADLKLGYITGQDYGVNYDYVFDLSWPLPSTNSSCLPWEAAMTEANIHLNKHFIRESPQARNFSATVTADDKVFLSWQPPVGVEISGYELTYDDSSMTLADVVSHQLDGFTFDGSEITFSLKTIDGEGNVLENCKSEATVLLVSNDTSAKVSSITGTSATEGQPVVFTVTLAEVLGQSFSLNSSLTNLPDRVSITDLSGATCSNGVTYSNSQFTIPAGTSAFTVSVPTAADGVENNDHPNGEPVTLKIGDISGNGLIKDISSDLKKPTISGGCDDVIEGNGLILTTTFSGKTSKKSKKIEATWTLKNEPFATSIENQQLTNGVTWHTDYTNEAGETVGYYTVPGDVAEFSITLSTKKDDADHSGDDIRSFGLSYVLGNAACSDKEVTDLQISPSLELSIDNPEYTEGASGDLTFTVTLSQSTTVETEWLIDITGTAINEYGLTISDLTFNYNVTHVYVNNEHHIKIPSGVNQFHVHVPISDNDNWSSDEYKLSLTINGVIGTGTIYDNEGKCTNSSYTGTFSSLWTAGTAQTVYNSATSSTLIKKFNAQNVSACNLKKVTAEIVTDGNGDGESVIGYLKATVDDNFNIKVSVKHGLSHADLDPGGTIRFAIKATLHDKNGGSYTVDAEDQSVTLGVSEITGISLNRREINNHAGYDITIRPHDKDAHLSAKYDYIYTKSGQDADKFDISQNVISLKAAYQQPPLAAVDPQTYHITIGVTKTINGQDYSQERGFVITDNSGAIAFFEDVAIFPVFLATLYGIYRVGEKIYDALPSLPRRNENIVNQQLELTEVKAEIEQIEIDLSNGAPTSSEKRGFLSREDIDFPENQLLDGQNKPIMVSGNKEFIKPDYLLHAEELNKSPNTINNAMFKLDQALKHNESYSESDLTFNKRMTEMEDIIRENESSTLRKIGQGQILYELSDEELESLRDLKIVLDQIKLKTNVEVDFVERGTDIPKLNGKKLLQQCALLN